MRDALIYAAGFATVPACAVVALFGRSTLKLWRSVRKYGGEDPRNLTRPGRVVQRAMQFASRAIGGPR